MAFPSAKRLGKRIIDYPEETVPVISSTNWFGQFYKDPKQNIKDYLLSLFPILTWITRYNVGWLSGDVIAGLTVGLVLVPQGLSYALLATLPAEYGLYSSFVGGLIYCFFATSKDISIGPVAVMSLTVAQIIQAVESKHPGEWGGPQTATVLTFLTGFIILGIGLLRLGWLVEFIPLPAISGFMTGSALNIAVGQVPGLMGITGFNTRAATYQVIINTLKSLPRTTLDAAFGLVGLFALYAIRMVCNHLGKKSSRRARIFFFISVLRNATVLIILTLAAWLYCRHRLSNGKYPIKILLTVPSGFKHIGQPAVDPKLVSALGPHLPLATIILLLEHIAIGKSFGRLNGYVINPNQELIAIGVTNTVGSCFGAYPATGSFSRSALKSQSGVRTPAAGILTAVVVIVALYGLTEAFFWIPTAGISAIIIHAVGDLISSPAQVYSFWRVAPLEFVIWWAAVLVTVFTSIEDGLYTSIIASLVLLLIRVALPRGVFLGKVTVRGNLSDGKATREVFVPLSNNGVTNPEINVTPPSPGIIIYRLEESYLYPNSSIVQTVLVDHVKKYMGRGKDMTNVKAADRPWNDAGSRGGGETEQERNLKKPILHAIVLDFSNVSHIDTTAVQALIDARSVIQKWADHPVEFHFATILSPWIHRALVAGGFGIGSSTPHTQHEIAAVVPYARDPSALPRFGVEGDLESGDVKKSDSEADSPPVGYASLVSTDTPFFHLDLTAAVNAAESGVGSAT